MFISFVAMLLVTSMVGAVGTVDLTDNATTSGEVEDGQVNFGDYTEYSSTADSEVGGSGYVGSNTLWKISGEYWWNGNPLMYEDGTAVVVTQATIDSEPGTAGIDVKTGQILWQKNPAQTQATTYGQGGAAMDDGIALIHLDDPYDGVKAIDTETGRDLWDFKFNEYDTNGIHVGSDGNFHIVHSDDSFYTVNRSGYVIQSRNDTADIESGQQSEMYEDVVYAPGYDQEVITYNVTANTTSEISVPTEVTSIGLDRETGTLFWVDNDIHLLNRSESSNVTTISNAGSSFDSKKFTDLPGSEFAYTMTNGTSSYILKADAKNKTIEGIVNVTDVNDIEGMLSSDSQGRIYSVVDSSNGDVIAVDSDMSSYTLMDTSISIAPSSQQRSGVLVLDNSIMVSGQGVERLGRDKGENISFQYNTSEEISGISMTLKHADGTEGNMTISSEGQTVVSTPLNGTVSTVSTNSVLENGSVVEIDGRLSGAEAQATLLSASATVNDGGGGGGAATGSDSEIFGIDLMNVTVVLGGLTLGLGGLTAYRYLNSEESYI
jgi:hypothetical protein